MTNFFGSVMETIHTDSAYKALSSKADFESSLDKSLTEMTDNSDDLGQTANLKPPVTSQFPSFIVDVCKHLSFSIVDRRAVFVQAQECPFTRTMSRFNERVKKIENIDSIVNHGLFLMLPLLLLSTHISS